MYFINSVAKILLCLFTAISGLCAFAEAPCGAGPGDSTRILTVDRKKLVSRADLRYNRPVARSEAGMPVGNGRMGTLVWTSPTALKMQINRVDVFANNRATHSFNRRDIDYAHGCGYFDIDFVDFGDDVFTDKGTTQYLSVYDALLNMDGHGVKTQVLAWHEEDVMAFQITDERDRPAAINARLRMLRLPEVYTRNHSAVSTLESRDGHIVLKQVFKEGDYYCSSAIVVSAQGRDAQVRLSDETGGKVKRMSAGWRAPELGQPTETEIKLAVEPGSGSFELFLASAASFDPDEDVVAKAMRQLDNARSKGFGRLLAANKSWWHNYWSKAFVSLHSADGVADEIEQHYTWFLYLMACTSRGAYPLDFSGMLFKTLGDVSAWGHQQWWNNLALYYQGLYAANRPELMKPLFNLYTGMRDACTKAASQAWGSKGIYIPETVWFDGPEELPEDLAAEVRDLYLLRKDWADRSTRFKEYADTRYPLVSLWNWKAVGEWVEGRWVYPDKGNPPFGHLPHLFESGPRIAYLYWKYYEYTLDKEWLREEAYPMIKGVAEFYRNYPNVKKGKDGLYHIHLVNNSEGVRGATDAIGSMAAMRGIFPVLLKASEILKLDADMRPVWQEFYNNLAPMPTSDHPDAPEGVEKDGPVYWIDALNPVVYGHVRPNVFPATYMDLCTVETGIANADLYNTGVNTFRRMYPDGVTSTTPVSVMSRTAITAARLGLTDDVKHAIPNQLRCLDPAHDFVNFDGTGMAGVLENRMTLREGVNALGAERLGNAAYAVHEALCQSNPPAPGKEPVIRVFAAWPKAWDAQFSLLCRGAFLVTSSMQNGQVKFVEIASQKGEKCALRNPWGSAKADLYKNGKKIRSVSGDLITFSTKQGEHFVLVPQGVALGAVKGKV